MKYFAEITGDFSGDREKEIRQALQILYGTMEGECTLDRNFGLNWDLVDLPLPEAKARMANEIIEKTMMYESDRAEVSSVTFSISGEGTLVPKVGIICLT